MIYHLAVATSFRGKGIGSRLMNEVEARCGRKAVSNVICLSQMIILRPNDYYRTAWLAAHGLCSSLRKRIAMTIRFGILTLSDRSSRGERADASGPALANLIQAEGWSVVKQSLLPDEESAIRELIDFLGR